jgi:4-amino-4-deoxy-L-arabinose transferase-like glycosyltransferase
MLYTRYNFHGNSGNKEPTAIQTSRPKYNDPLELGARSGSAISLKRALNSVPVFLACTVLAALVLRLIVVSFVVGDTSAHNIDLNNFGWESWEMGWVARSIFHGQGFSSPFLPITGPTALVPPLYPYLLAGIFHFFGLYTAKSAFTILGFNSLCSSLTCIPLFFLVRNSLGRRSARIAAIAWAIYPFAVYFAADRIWDYALTGLLFTTSLLVAQRLHLRGWLGWTGFGVLYGVTILSNPSVVSLLPFLLLIAMYKVWRVRGARLRNGLLASVAFIMVCIPWTIRNHRVMHADFFIRDGFWLEFYAGNNGDTTASNSAFAHPASNPAEMVKYQQMGELRYMAEKHDLAVDFVKHHPLFFAVSTVRRVIRFWTGYWSFSPSYLKYEPMDLPNVPFCLFLLFFTVRGLRRWWKEDAQAALPYVLSLVVFPIPYYFTHSSMDYRQPLEPILIVLVTIGLFGTGAHPFAYVEVEEQLELPEFETEPAAIATHAYSEI